MPTPIDGDQAEAERVASVAVAAAEGAAASVAVAVAAAVAATAAATAAAVVLPLGCSDYDYPHTHTQTQSNAHRCCLYRHTSHLISDRADAGGAICCASILLPYQSAQILLMPKKSTYSVHARHGAAADVLQSEFDIEFESVNFASRRRSLILHRYRYSDI